MQKQLNILLLEDSKSDADLIRRMLRGYTSFKPKTEWFSSLGTALKAIEKQDYDLIVTDLCLPDSTGVDTIGVLSTRAERIPIIALTSEDTDLGREAIRAGASDFIPKDKLTKTVLCRAVDYTIERFEMTRELQEANAMLEEQNDRLAQMCKTSQKFVDNVSHEFRTPLTVIREFAAIVRDGIDGPVTPKQESRLTTLINRTDDLALMVDDLLDTSRLRSGLLKTCRKVNNLKEIVSQVETMLKQRAEAKEISLTADSIPENSLVFCDDEKLRRILINLVVNAIKFTPVKGKITISTSVADENRVKITVSDTGHGIPKDDLNRIFNRFQQVSAHERMASCKGFGLGLSIARSLATLNLGSLQVASVEGRGSQFSVLLPTARVDAVLNCFLDQREAIAGNEGEIGVVEVRPEVTTSQSASDVSEAVDDFLRSNIKNFDLVLQMAQDRWLLYTNTSKTTLPWLLLRFRDEWTKLQRNHFAGTLPDLIFQSIDTFKLLGNREQLLQIAETKEAPTWNVEPVATNAIIDKKRVLVVDDEYEVALAIQSRLIANGFDVETVHNGRDGLEAVNQSRPDAILLDIRMPEMDGLAVLDQLKSDSRTKVTPVIMLSASHHDQQAALDRGADFFVRKPFKSEAIVAALNSAILESEASLCSLGEHDG
jgi:signal transduction histidine kinase